MVAVLGLPTGNHLLPSSNLRLRLLLLVLFLLAVLLLFLLLLLRSRDVDTFIGMVDLDGKPDARLEVQNRMGPAARARARVRGRDR